MRRSITRLALSALAIALVFPGIAAADPGSTSLAFTQPPPPSSPPSPEETGRTSTAVATDPTLPNRFDPEWTIQVEPLAWFAGPSGKLSLPVNSGTGPGNFTDNGDKIRVNDIGLSQSRLSPAGQITFASGKWRLAFWGSAYDTSRDGVGSETSGRLGSVEFATGDPLNVELSFGLYELTLGYRLVEYDFCAASKGDECAVHAVFTLHLIGGGRIYDVSTSVESVLSSARADASHLFIEPILGGRFELELAEEFSVIAQVSIGALPTYTTSSFTFDVTLGFQWRPTPAIGVQIGWRQLGFDLEHGRDNDKFEYNGFLAGLFAGVVIRF